MFQRPGAVPCSYTLFSESTLMRKRFGDCRVAAIFSHICTSLIYLVLFPWFSRLIRLVWVHADGFYVECLLKK